MAHLCMKHDNNLAVLHLGASPVGVEVGADGSLAFRPVGYAEAAAVQPAVGSLSAVFAPWQDAARLRWSLVAAWPGDVTANGTPLLGGLRVLRHRDGITFRRGVRPVFYLDEDPAQVQPFPVDRAEARCSLCRGEIRAGTTAVRCPGCGQWYHMAEQRCWTYNRHCLNRTCRHATELNGRFSWTPKGL